MSSTPPPLAIQESTDEEWSRPDNRFIPVRACDLTRHMAGDAANMGLTSESIHTFASSLEGVIDRELGTFERRLADAYAHFNPDRETQPAASGTQSSANDYESLCSQLALLLDKANYEELSDVEIARAVMRARSRNLTVRVDPNRVEFLRLWVRGRGEVTKQQRRRWKPWRYEGVSVPVFKRLVVVVRLKNDPHVILKLFKDIPEAEAEALLPHAEVQMSLWDRIKLLGTGAGTLGVTVSKILKIAIGFAALWKLAWILLIGVATLGIRAALGYRNARINRDWQRTRHLYFQNMGNNASALQLLVAKVKQEEFKETLLLYLMRHAEQHDAEAQAQRDTIDRLPIGERIERYLKQRFGVDVDFDLVDAEDKLAKLGLNSVTDPTQVLPIDEAVEVLHRLGQGRSAPVRMMEQR